MMDPDQEAYYRHFAEFWGVGACLEPERIVPDIGEDSAIVTSEDHWAQLAEWCGASSFILMYR
jgi:hypothetical protein